MPSKVILIVIEFMFLGINMFWARLRLILAQAAREQNIFMPAKINSIYCYLNDISASSSKFEFFLFADDTNLFHKDKSLPLLEWVVNEEVINVCG